jgi:hypothetical protein
MHCLACTMPFFSKKKKDKKEKGEFPIEFWVIRGKSFSKLDFMFGWNCYLEWEMWYVCNEMREDPQILKKIALYRRWVRYQHRCRENKFGEFKFKLEDKVYPRSITCKKMKWYFLKWCIIRFYKTNVAVSHWFRSIKLTHMEQGSPQSYMYQLGHAMPDR